MARVLAESATLAEATPRLLEVLGETLEWGFGGVWEMDPRGEVLRCVDTWCRSGLDVTEFAEVTRQSTFPAGVGLPGRVWESAEPAWIVDVTRDPTFVRADAAGRAGLRAAFAFPIRGRRGLLAVMDFFSSESREPDEDLLEMMAATGHQIGQFIERRRAEEAVRDSEARMRAMLDAALDCVITIDHRGRVVEFNAAAERTFGYRRGEAVGREMGDLIVPPRLRQRHRAGLARYLETGEGPVLNRRIELSGMRADGSEFPVELTITAIPLEGPPMFTGYVRDITQRKRAEEGQRFLARAGEALAESLDYEQTLAKVASLAVPHVADWCSVDLLGDDGELHNVSVAHVDPAKVELARELRRRYPPRRDDPTGVPNVIRTGRAELYEEIPEALLADVARDEEHLRLLRELRLVSAMIVPLSPRGRTLGAITLVSAESAHRYDASDLALAEDLARRAALAIDNARLYHEEHAVAEVLQRSLLPERLPEIPGVAAAARYLPGAPAAEVGGDWYDIVSLPSGEVGLVIGDVAGRGVAAASVMGQLRNAIRMSALEGQSPCAAVGRVNQLVHHLENGAMATVAYLVLDPRSGSLRQVSAGHPPPLLVAPDGEARYLEECRSLPVGVVAHARYEECSTVLERGSTVLLYTDGLVERRDRSLRERLVELKHVVREGAAAEDGDLEALCDRLLGRLVGDEARADDVALLALRWLPSTERLSLRPVAEPESVPSVRRSLSRWLRELGASPRETYELSVACSEAVANVVEHAYGAGDERFELEAAVEGEEVAIRVRDFGRWRRPRGAHRGRGLHLIEGLTDAVDVSSGPEGTCVDMRRRLGEEAA